jgi:glutathione synthase/RimK-type ligase-like ATP-grasp enzyme
VRRRGTRLILVMGSTADPVIARVTAALARAGTPFACVDEVAAKNYEIERSVDGGNVCWQIRGEGCVGRRAVGAIFVRHESNAPNRETLEALRKLRRQIDLLLLSTVCMVINRPACATSNYSKPYQLRQMAAAGFLVPRTLVTNIPRAARYFIRDLGGSVIFKGVSNLKTAPQVVQLQHLKQLSRLEHCSAQFQEFIPGEDFRVTVVDAAPFVTRIIGGEPDLGCPVEGSLSSEVLHQCVRFTRQQGLVMSGIDLRRTFTGRVYAFELNPYPLFTYYEAEEQPRITEGVVEYLVKHQHAAGDVRV